MLTAKYKLKNGFEISKLMREIDIDFVYSQDNGRLLLLNQEIFGEIDKSIMDSQKEGSRIVVVDNKKMIMEVYNIEQNEMDQAIVKV